MRDRANASKIWRAALEELDRSGYALAVQTFETDAPDDDPFHALWRAEVLVYLDRLDAAEAELAHAVDLEHEFGIRRDLVVAEISLWRGAHAECLAEATRIEGVAQRWPRLAARAQTLVARSAMRRGDWKAALALIPSATKVCTDLGLVYQQGILRHCDAYARIKLSDVKGAGQAFRRALEHFAEHPDTRWESYCRGLHGGWLFEIGSLAEAEAEFMRAREYAQRLDLVHNMLVIENAYAQLLVLQRRYEQAISILEYLTGWNRAGQYGTSEANNLVTLALAYVLRGDAAAAERPAAEGLRLAHLEAADDLVIDGELMVAWVGSKLGKTDSIAKLRRALDHAEHKGTQQQAYKGRLFLSDALIEERPDEAADHLARARSSAEVEISDVYSRVLDHVETRAKLAPIVVDASGVLTIDVRRSFPAFVHAIQLVTRFLIEQALRRVPSGRGRLTRAAEMLGLDRRAFHDKYKLAVLRRPTRDRYRAPADRDGR